MTAETETEPDLKYSVVVYFTGEYSILPLGRTLPLGWSEAGFSGTKQECLDYIQSVWRDLRPDSLRSRMDGRMGGE